jgi:cobaltochelatase CobS
MMDRFILCEVNYPGSEAEELLLEKTTPQLPDVIRKKMVEYAGEVRRLFMGNQADSHSGNAIEVTFSTRTLLRWADLTIRYQPLAKLGIQPVAYALDRALGFRACKETRALLHEIAQRIFPMQKGKQGE